MPPSPFQYAIVRVVPRVERGECVNAGVVLFCRPRRFLAARVALLRAASGTRDYASKRERFDDDAAQAAATVIRLASGSSPF